jgi:regulation of enolase protein 1 (concanavalin A-like superfamily)
MMRPTTFFSFLASLAMAASANAATITVAAGGNLQAALNQAAPGDTIVLAAGATYTGNFVLPAKGGTSYITIRSSAADSSLPAAGTRIAPSYASVLPKLQSASSGQAALATAPGASFYVIQFLEFLSNPSGTGAMLDLGSAASSQNSLAVVPHDLIVDRCYLHSSPGVAQLRGIALNSGKTTIRDSYISEIKYAGQDSQAIAGWNGPGPFTITNNYLEAAGENFLMGGSSMFIPNTTPTGIEFRNNYLTKQVAWRNSSWTVKNIFELKHAQDVTVDGNVFENNWLAAQPGYSIVFTPRNQYGDNNWTVVQRVTFTNNIVRHVSSVFNILGWDNNATSQQTNHITIRNNVFEDVNAANWGGSGRILLISQAPYVTLDHNTGFNSASAVYAYNGPSDHFAFTNNIVNTATYGIIGDATGEGNGTIATYFATGSFLENVFVACKLTGAYPAQNYFASAWSNVGFTNLSGGDYHLASSSPYKGKATDGNDIGADIDALNAALAKSTASGSGGGTTDLAPTVAITSPSAGTALAAPATVSIAAAASDSDGTPVAKVAFYANGTLVGTATTSPYSVSWTNVAAGSYSLTAVATDTGGKATTSAAVSVTASAPGGTGSVTVLPAPWSDGDIGSTGAAGGATYTSSSGLYIVKGAGADIWGSSDSFNFASQALSGDGEIVARVTGVQNTSSMAKGGVMFRDGLSSGAAHVMLDVKPGGGVEFMSRSTSGGATAYLGGTTLSLPAWVKLARSGSTFKAYTSTDGNTWTTVGSTTVAMSASPSVGLLVCSHVSGTLDTSTFDHVSVKSAASAALTDADIGTVGLAGSSSSSGGVVTVKGAGADIWGSADSFHFAYQAMSGDGQVVARVTGVQNTSSLAKAGVMIRDTLAAGAVNVLLDVKPGGGSEFMSRSATNGATSYLAGATASVPVWVKLVRTGTTVTGYTSTDGTNWTTVAATTVPLGTNVYAGLVVCSHSTTTLNTSTFSNVTVGK